MQQRNLPFVVLVQVAVVTAAFCVVRQEGMRALPSSGGPRSLMVAGAAHVLGVVLAVGMRTGSVCLQFFARRVIEHRSEVKIEGTVGTAQRSRDEGNSRQT